MSSSPDGCPVFWFTGLSGAGKTTIAKTVSAELGLRGLSVVLFDGDEVRRQGRNSRHDRLRAERPPTSPP